ncbi:anthranilate synthase component I [Fischerella sp. PCC 9605]|uniref:anthranilate synthase component I n=1 Tax=Fischerella sp. PCC 9605 TaxID=1173024 RepID=UPI00047E2F36|nr:anthranilate synthase component I [Fischerella sp. PCC 9605]
MTQCWYWRSLPLEKRTGSDIFAALFGYNHTSTIATLLESPNLGSINNSQLARYSICAGAPRYVDGHPQMWTPPLGKVLPFLEQLLARKENAPPLPFTPSSSLPFTGGWLGWLGYDIAWEIEQLPYTKSDSLPFPVAFWYEPECFAVLDRWEQVLWLAASSTSGLDELERKLEQGDGEMLRDGEMGRWGDGEMKKIHPITVTPHFQTSQEEYEATVNLAKKYIQAGDIFQANLSLRFEAQTTASGWEIYRVLQQINPSPFACYFRTPWGEVISCSPERLVQSQRCRDAKFRVSTRPIAGTRSRASAPEKDQQLAADLLSNTKERAEHIMLVDLERNDLGRVCEWGSVEVDELLTIERYSHVMHLVSNIKGILRSDLSTIDLIRAMFPGGTITGCPKVRCMEIIEELEPVRRSLFYGSCGYLDWRGNLDLNILIRTLLLAPSLPKEREWGLGARGKGGEVLKQLPHSCTPALLHSPTPPLNTVWGQVGAGIVADSDPEREWHESLHKAQAQLKALLGTGD